MRMSSGMAINTVARNVRSTTGEYVSFASVDRTNCVVLKARLPSTFP